MNAKPFNPGPVTPTMACMMESILFGAFTVLSFWSIRISNRGAIPQILRIASYCAFGFSVAHLTINFKNLWPLADYLVQTVEGHRGLEVPIIPLHSTWGDMILTSMSALHDFTLIWRLYKVWNDSYLVCFPSTLLWVGMIASGLATSWTPQPPPGPTPHSTGRLQNWRLLWACFRVFNNLLTAGLITYKMLKLRRDAAVAIPPSMTNGSINTRRKENVRILDGAIVVVVAGTTVHVTVLIVGAVLSIFYPASTFWSRPVLAQMTVGPPFTSSTLIVGED